MRRRLTPFVQVAFGLLASHLLLAQHVGLGGQGRVGVGQSYSAPSRSIGLPSGPTALRPGIRHPTLPIHEGSGQASGVLSHRPDDGRRGDYRNHTPYIYAGYTWLNPLGYGSPVGYGGLPYAGQDDAGGGPQPGPQESNNVDQLPPDVAPEPPGPQVADNAPPAFRPAYQGGGVDAPINPQPATRLIFKDGRPPVEVHNYALTANTLYANDGDSRQEIPLSLLNVQATVEANRAAGVDFALPISH